MPLFIPQRDLDARTFALRDGTAQCDDQCFDLGEDYGG